MHTTPSDSSHCSALHPIRGCQDYIIGMVQGVMQYLAAKAWSGVEGDPTGTYSWECRAFQLRGSLLLDAYSSHLVWSHVHQPDTLKLTGRFSKHTVLALLSAGKHESHHYVSALSTHRAVAEALKRVWKHQYAVQLQCHRKRLTHDNELVVHRPHVAFNGAVAVGAVARLAHNALIKARALLYRAWQAHVEGQVPA